MNVQTARFIRSDSVHELVHSCVTCVWECALNLCYPNIDQRLQFQSFQFVNIFGTNQLFYALSGVLINFAQVMQLGTRIGGVREKLWSVLISAKRSIN